MASKRIRSGFGALVASLREARGLTQEQLGARSDLSPDTIRRLEHDVFSPSLDTLCGLARGLRVQLSTLFEAYELGERDHMRELVDLVTGRSDADIDLATAMLRMLLSELDRRVRSADE